MAEKIEMSCVEMLAGLIGMMQDEGRDYSDCLDKGAVVANTALAEYLVYRGVVLPVRCDECKHSKEYRCRADPMRNHRLCYKDDVTVRFVEDDFYCAYGERKDNE